MKIAVFSTKAYTERSMRAANGAYGHDLFFFEERLNRETADLAAGSEAVCVFVNDVLDETVLARLAELGVRLVALRCRI